MISAPYDDIRLAFRVQAGWIEISEADEGWSDLSAALRRHFPSAPPDWYWTVMSPAFATNYHGLYERR